MAEGKQVTVAHASFWYTKPSGTYSVAMRGDLITVGEDDYARGSAAGAFSDGAPEPAGVLPDFPVGGTVAEQDAWVRSATVGEVLAAANASPDNVGLLISAEERRGSDARKTSLEGLATLLSRLEASAPYDPAKYTVEEVQDYLALADDAERARVLDLERAGQNRVGLVGS